MSLVTLSTVMRRFVRHDFPVRKPCLGVEKKLVSVETSSNWITDDSFRMDAKRSYYRVFSSWLWTWGSLGPSSTIRDCAKELWKRSTKGTNILVEKNKTRLCGSPSRSADLCESSQMRMATTNSGMKCMLSVRVCASGQVRVLMLEFVSSCEYTYYGSCKPPGSK